MLKTLALLSLSLDVYADSETTTPTFIRGESLKEGQIPSAYNQSSSYSCTNGWDVFITANYLYWDWTQSSFLLGTTTPIEDTTLQGSTGSRTTYYQTPGYASGFKVGAGFKMPGMDDWNLYSEYTWYRNSDTTSLSSGPGNITILPSAALLATDTALGTLEGMISSKVQMMYDSLDFLAKRPFYFGKKLTANFGAGLRALWISQEFTRTLGGFNGPDLLDSIDRRATSKPTTWAIGPKFSFETNWMLGYGIKVMMNLATSLLYTRYTLNTEGSAELVISGTPYSTTFSWEAVPQINALRPITEAFLGLGWSYGFFDGQYRVSLSGGYDFNIYWNYDMLYYSTSQTRGDMFLQGLNVQARFDF